MPAPHHPWRTLRRMTDWTLHFAVLPAGVMGLTLLDEKVIILAPGMTQAERRCTLQHELEHAHGEPDDAECDRNAARRLMPDIRVVADALTWAVDLAEAAHELWVDEEMLTARLHFLHPAERAYLHRRFAD